MEKSTRVQRVERELFTLLSNYVLHELSGTPPCYVSISAVDVTGDLRSARVFFRLVGAIEQTREGEKLLEGERKRMQRFVADEFKAAKFCPVLRFEFGVAPHFDEVDQLFQNMRRTRTFEDEN